MKSRLLLSIAALTLLAASPKRAPVSFIALGDSYTVGTGLVDYADAWPNQLKKIIDTTAGGAEPPVVIARSGWTAGELRDAIDADKPARTFTWAIVFVGTNNEFRGEPVEKFMGEFRQVLDRALPLAGGVKKRVVIASIPDYSVTPFGKKRNPERTAKNIETFNAAIRAEAIARGHRWVDVTRVSRLAAGKPELISSDGLHPAKGMHSVWARDIFQPMRDTFTDLWGPPRR